MIVFRAILLDAYRELNSRKLFWVVLGLSVLFILVYGSIGFDETGMSILYGLKHFENEALTYDSPMSRLLYRSLFSTVILGVWLTWIATILALISTCTIFPDFVAGGSIDLVLSKPVRRISLFFMKYAASLLFVLLQVAVICIGAFLCMGLRLGDWEWKLLLAIPVVLLFYSYLYSVCVLIGVRFGSALAALLVTLIFWFSMFSLNITESSMAGILAAFEDENRYLETAIVENEEQAARLEPTPRNAKKRLELEKARTQMTAQIEGQRQAREYIEPIQRVLHGIAWVTPKTSATIGLLDEWLRQSNDINMFDLLGGRVERSQSDGFVIPDMSAQEQQERRMSKSAVEQVESRSLWYVIGTSLIFEGLVLALACWIFIRRDF